MDVKANGSPNSSHEESYYGSISQLAMQKDFKDITIKDITTSATVNRVTFYNHFYDKYELLEKVLSESVMREVIEEVSTHQVINEESIKSILLSIVRFHTSLSNQCSRSYKAFKPQIEIHFKNELQVFFSKWAHIQWPNQNNTDIEVFSVALNWALYGTAMHLMQNQQTEPEKYLQQLMPLIDAMNKEDAHQI